MANVQNAIPKINKFVPHKYRTAFANVTDLFLLVYTTSY